jgi:hypothetical protein
LLPGPDDEEPGFAWLRFAGRWGEVPAGTTACRGCGPGPAGPVYNSNGAKWKSPLEWGGQRLTRDDLIANRTARVTVDGAGRTHVYDSLSRHTGPLVTGALETAIPGSVHLTRPGTRRAIVLLPGFTDRTAGRVEIEGGEIRSLRVLLPSEFGSAEHQFPRVVLGPTGVARMDLGSDAPALRIDADGDGSFERQVLPLAPQIPPP